MFTHYPAAVLFPEGSRLTFVSTSSRATQQRHSHLQQPRRHGVQPVAHSCLCRASQQLHIAQGHETLLVHLLSNHGGRPTRAAQMAWQQVIQPGDTVVDATCGNGHDTLCLAQAVGPTGCVWAVDIQAAAVESTKQRLEDELPQQLRPKLQVVQGCHSQLQQLVGSNTARVVCFNLGYLPKGDKQVITKPGTTLAAVEAALEVVCPGGLVSIMAYIKHPGGLEEYEGVKQLLQELAPTYWVSSEVKLLNRATAPILLLVWRKPDVGPPALYVSF